MSDLVRYETPAVDSWASVMPQIGELATRLAGTDFVPDTMRGKPAAVAAAILTGRELGVGPMTALQQIYIVHGRPGMYAKIKVALAQAAGLATLALSRQQIDLLASDAAERLAAVLQPTDALVVVSAKAPCKDIGMLRDNLTKIGRAHV